MATADIPSLCLTYKYRLLPNRRQHAALERILDQQRDLYNCALQERRDAYRKQAMKISYVDQCGSLAEIRQTCEGWKIYPSCLQRGTLKRLDEAFKGFFRRIKAGQESGYPRFKGRGQFTSFAFSEFSGITLTGNRLYFKGLPGGLRVHFHRALPNGKPLSVKFVRDSKGWAVCFAVRVPCVAPRSSKHCVGIDLGLTHLATLSTSETILNPRTANRAQKKLRLGQRALARCKKGSKRRKKVKARLTRLHYKIKNTRRTYMHQVSAWLVRDYDYIAIENLRIRNMVKNKHLSASIHDASWGLLVDFLTYKGEKTGASVIKVEARNTSQLCSGCGEKVPKKLHVRMHNCPHCGLVLDRDHNAALNILARGRTGSRATEYKAVA